MILQLSHSVGILMFLLSMWWKLDSWVLVKKWIKPISSYKFGHDNSEVEELSSSHFLPHSYSSKWCLHFLQCWRETVENPRRRFAMDTCPPKHENIPCFQWKSQYMCPSTCTHTLLYILPNTVHNLLKGYILNSSAFSKSSAKDKCCCLSLVK